MAALFGALAVLQSIVITNKRFAVISPVIMHTVLSFIVGVIKPPTFLDALRPYTNHPALYMDFGGTLDNMTFLPIAALYPIIHCSLSTAIIAFCVFRLVKIKVGNKI